MARGEHDLWVNYMAEASRLLGHECNLYEVVQVDKDSSHDPYVQYKEEPVRINILFEDNPKPTLKKLGWYNESEDLPYVAYMTYLSDKYEKVSIEEHSIVEIPHEQIPGVLKNSKFMISSISGSTINPLFWIVKLVPYRYNLDKPKVEDKESADSEQADLGFSYFKRGDKT